MGTLSLPSLTLYGIGEIIGGGIFVLLGQVIKHAGNDAWKSILISGIAAMMTGMSYVSMSKKHLRDSAEYDFVKSAFGKFPAIINTISIIFAGIFTSATVANAFGKYVQNIIDIDPKIIGVVFIAILTAVNLIGLKSSTIINNIITAIEILSLVALSVYGLNKGKIKDLPKNKGVIYGAFIFTFAYWGFESIVKFASDTKNTKITTTAIVLSIAICAAIYILVSQMATRYYKEGSDTIIADVASNLFGNKGVIIFTGIAMLSMFNTAMIPLLTRARLLSSAFGNKGIFAMDRNRVPRYMVIAMALITAVICYFGNLENLTQSSNYLTLFSLLTINLSAFYLKKSLTPILGIISIIILLFKSQ